MEDYFVAAASAIFAGGSAVGYFKWSLNGTKDRVKKLEEGQKELLKIVSKLDGKVDILLEK